MNNPPDQVPQLKAPGHPVMRLVIRLEPDVVSARQKAKRLAFLLGFDSQDQARIATAVSELARNVFQYVGSGSIEFSFSETGQIFFIKVSDSGPGINCLDELLNGTYVSKTGLGVGLMGSKKLMDFFDLKSSPSEGTEVVIGKVLDKRSAKITAAQLGPISQQLMLKDAQSPFEEIQAQNRELFTALDELRTSKNELSELNRELAETNRGVVALYAELDEKASSLQKANEIKTRFLSNMTHEFRTPLSSIISLTRLLLQHLDGELNLEQEKQVRYIQKSGETLLELVGDLLDLAKVEAGKVSLNVANFGVSEVIMGLRGMFRPIIAADPGLSLDIDWQGEEFFLETDQGKLAQILRNLISNAVKFTEKGTITVHAYKEGHDMARFSVQDTGVGIEAKHLEAIFEDFSQVDAGLPIKQKGTGLGLPLSRKLARLLGGDLWVETRRGHGSIFHVKIPLKYEGAAVRVLIGNEQSGVPTETGSSRFRVLLVDDDEASRYVLKSLVSSELDADFEEAVDGLQAIEMLKVRTYDLIFLDIVMPRADGFEVLTALESLNVALNTPVIINSTKALDSSDQIRGHEQVKAAISKDRLDSATAIKDLRRALVKAGFDYKSM